MTETSPKFGLQADVYARFRPHYSSDVYAHLLENLGGARDHAVDLGAGTGQVSGDLLNHFARVTAVEPDADMAARIAPHEHLSVQVAPAEAADVAAGDADAVVSGTAFHWMDADVVCANARRWLRPGGVFFMFSYEQFSSVGPASVAACIGAEAIKWAKFKDERLLAWASYEKTVQATGVFDRVEPVSIAHEWRVSPQDAAGFYLSTSFAAAYGRSTGDEAAYAADFMSRMAEAADGEEVVARYFVDGVMAWA